MDELKLLFLISKLTKIAKWLSLFIITLTTTTFFIDVNLTKINDNKKENDNSSISYKKPPHIPIKTNKGMSTKISDDIYKLPPINKILQFYCDNDSYTFIFNDNFLSLDIGINYFLTTNGNRYEISRKPSNFFINIASIKNNTATINAVYTKHDDSVLQQSFVIKSKKYHYDKDVNEILKNFDDIVYIKSDNSQQSPSTSSITLAIKNADNCYHICNIAKDQCAIFFKDRWIPINDNFPKKYFTHISKIKIADNLASLKISSPHFPKKKFIVKTIEDKWDPQEVVGKLSFLGTKSNSQAIIEVDDKKFFIKSGDALTKNKDNWYLLRDGQFSEDNMTTTGEIFIFDNVRNELNKFFLTGKLKSKFRTQICYVKIPIKSKKL